MCGACDGKGGTTAPRAADLRQYRREIGALDTTARQN